MPISTYKLIRSLPPIIVFNIITKGLCKLTDKTQEKLLFLTSSDWCNKIDMIDVFLSDSSMGFYTSKSEAESLELEFKKWNIFYEVWSRWYGGNTYLVGFRYTYEAFEILHREYKINEILKSKNGLHTI